MYPGADVVRASYRGRTAKRRLLVPGTVYRLQLPSMLTANTFKRGHRIRVHLMTTFFPHFSRNLHTGRLETTSARMRTARITIYHDRSHPSRLILPVVGGGAERAERAEGVGR
jgi:predicted acyl esterase